jgi:hypothetical protein
VIRRDALDVGITVIVRLPPSVRAHLAQQALA